MIVNTGSNKRNWTLVLTGADTAEGSGYISWAVLGCPSNNSTQKQYDDDSKYRSYGFVWAREGQNSARDAKKDERDKQLGNYQNWVGDAAANLSACTIARMKSAAQTPLLVDSIAESHRRH